MLRKKNATVRALTAAEVDAVKGALNFAFTGNSTQSAVSLNFAKGSERAIIVVN